MNNSTPTALECFQREAQADCAAWIEMATSGYIGGFVGLPAAVGDTADLYFSLGIQGKLSISNVLLLKQALGDHLEISKRHAQLWIHPNPDAKELALAWYQQTESLAAWNRFVALVNRLEDIKAAYELAFEGFPPQPPQFRNAEDRILFATNLKNEQQDDIGGSNHIPVRVLEQERLFSQLEPTQQSLLTLLLDGKPKTVAQLLYALYGQRAQTEQNKRKLTRRISDLNKALEKIWGQPPQDRWIERTFTHGESTYQLLAGKTAL